MEPGAYDELNALEATHWWYEGMRRITHCLLDDLLHNQHELVILDAGCGAGGNLTALSSLGTVVGIDYSPLALRYTAPAHAGKLARASINALPYPDKCFDLVTSFDVLYCAEVPDDIAAVQELARVTKPGGLVLIRLPALPILKGPHDLYVHGVRRYTTSDLDSKLAYAGLTTIRLTYANSILLPLIFISRQIGNLMVCLGREPTSDVNPTVGFINQSLIRVLDLEAKWIRSGHSLPAGVSLFGLARKPQ